MANLLIKEKVANMCRSRNSQNLPERIKKIEISDMCTSVNFRDEALLLRVISAQTAYRN